MKPLLSCLLVAVLAILSVPAANAQIIINTGHGRHHRHHRHHHRPHRR